MEQYGLSFQQVGPVGPVPPMRVSSLNAYDTRTLSSAGRSSEASSMRSGRSGLSFESGRRTSQESTKPRLSKEQQDFLERQFSAQQKPNTQAKKIFANDLNVSLEKVNNWFQNRRAKSKQDAKKNGSQQYSTPVAYPEGYHPSDQGFVDRSFYQHPQPSPAMHGQWQPMLPGQSIEPYVSTTSARFGVPLDISGVPRGPPFSDQISKWMHEDPNPEAEGFDLFFGFENVSNNASAQNMYGRQFPGPEPGTGMMDTIPEYEVPRPRRVKRHSAARSLVDRSSLPQARSGAEEASFGHQYSPRNGDVRDLPMPPSADFFHPNEAQHDGYAVGTWGNSAGRPLDSEQYAGLNAAMGINNSHLPAAMAMNNSHLPAAMVINNSRFPDAMAMNNSHLPAAMDINNSHLPNRSPEAATGTNDSQLPIRTVQTPVGPVSSSYSLPGTSMTATDSQLSFSSAAASDSQFSYNSMAGVDSQLSFSSAGASDSQHPYTSMADVDSQLPFSSAGASMAASCPHLSFTSAGTVMTEFDPTRPFYMSENDFYMPGGVMDMCDLDFTNGQIDAHSALAEMTTPPPQRASQSQELMIQQFSPREPVDSSRLPPKMKPNDMPKQFEFQTCGPESFSTP